MSIDRLVRAQNLGPEFELGTTVPDQITICVDGTTITRDPVTGCLSATPGGVALQVETTPIYEYRDVWAEEGAGLADNSAQWSYGNGATGFIGLPIDDGWEVQAMYFHADTGNAATDLTLELVDFTTPSTAAPVIASLDVSVAAGDGVVNNVYRYEEFDPRLPVPAGAVLGFRTQEDGGNAADGRVGARLCRLQADVVTGVRLL